MSSSDFTQLRRELSLLGIQVPDVVAVIEQKNKEMLVSKNALYNEVEELTKKLDRQKKKTDEWEMAYCEQEHLAEGFCEENKKLREQLDAAN